MGSLLTELKRRKVFRVAAVYAVVAWLLIQVADVVLPTFGAPGWVNQTLIFLFILGFPIAVVLAWAYEATPGGIRPDHTVQASPGRQATSAQPINYLILLIVLAMAAVQIGDRWLDGDDSVELAGPAMFSTDQPVFRSQIDLGLTEAQAELGDVAAHSVNLEFLPDGEGFIYAVGDFAGNAELRMRLLNSLESELILESDAGISYPSVSPDGRRVAFNTGSFPVQLAWVDINGGTPSGVDTNVKYNGLGWLDPQTLVYSITDGTVLTLNVDTGERREILSMFGDLRLSAFEPLPHSDFVLASQPVSSRYNVGKVVALNVATGVTVDVISNAISPTYSPTGHLLFVRDSNLWAAPFDAEQVELTGQETMIVEGIESLATGPGSAIYGLSRLGQLLYFPGGDVYGRADKRLVWLRRDGSISPLDLPPGNYEDPVISPDGTRLALTVSGQGAPDIWTHEFSQPGILNRVTNTGNASDPVWSPGGNQLVFRLQSLAAPGSSLARIDANGLGLTEELIASETNIFPREFDADDSLLYIDTLDSDSGQNIVRLDVFNLDQPRQILLAAEYNEFGPSISPDGRWLVYSSDETGRQEIYLRPYPDLDAGKWRISMDGGEEPKWGRDPAVLHYTSDGRTVLHTVRLQLEPQFAVVDRQALDLGPITFTGVPYYAVGSTDDEFLVMQRANAESEVDQSSATASSDLAVPVHNFFAELNLKAPPDPL